MQPHVRAATSAAVRTGVNRTNEDPDRAKSVGAGGILLLLGVTVGVYAFSPGARHFYKHGHLPSPGRGRMERRR